MKIDKIDVAWMVVMALAGIAFMNFVAFGSLGGSLIGAVSGAAGGCVFCIFRRLLKQYGTKQNNTPDGIRR